MGTRPQIIKLPILLSELKKRKFNVQTIHSGQHYDYVLSQKNFKDLHIPNPTINLEVGSGTHLQQISKIFNKLEKWFKKHRPDFVIIPGDTTSAVASALVCSKMGIKFGHLEAGARSNQFSMSEEINRRIIDHCSDVLFAPTKNCLQNLKNENLGNRAIFVGDTMYDLFLKQKNELKLMKLQKGKIQNRILITIHRFENINEKNNLKKICSLINNLVKANYEVVFPLHPHTKKMLKKFNLNTNAKIIQPIGYLDILKTLSLSRLVITDSGGLQKEAYWTETPCITIRESTEWVETINEKANRLYSLDNPFNIGNLENIISKKIHVKPSLFGDGKASEKISNFLKTYKI